MGIPGGVVALDPLPSPCSRASPGTVPQAWVEALWRAEMIPLISAGVKAPGREKPLTLQGSILQ